MTDGADGARGETSEVGDDRLPWEGEARTADLVCLFAISATGIYALVLLPFKPALIGTHPVLLELLAGTISSMVTAGAFARVGDASLELAMVAGIIGLIKFDPLFWWAGNRWGRRAAALIAGNGPKATRSIVRIERVAERIGWLAVLLAYFLPIPTAIVFAAAGWTGMRLRTFLALDAIGALLWVGLCVGLGYAIGQSAVDVAKAISRYALWLSIVIVVGVIAGQVWRARRSAGG